MSAWVDFGLYSLQAVLLWIVVPAWGKRHLSLGGVWVPALRAWGLLSVLALLAYRLDKVPPPLSAQALRKADWEALLMTSNLLLALGLLFAGVGVLRFMRWLKENSTATESRGTDSFALTRDDLLPRTMQRLVYGQVLAALLARPVAGLIASDRVQDIWGNFFTGLVLAALLFAAAGGSVMRAPNPLDRMLGGRWRQTEVGACYLLMGNLALLEMTGLALELSGLHSRRALALLVAAFICLTLAGLMLLSRRTPPSSATDLQDDP